MQTKHEVMKDGPGLARLTRRAAFEALREKTLREQAEQLDAARKRREEKK